MTERKGNKGNIVHFPKKEQPVDWGRRNFLKAIGVAAAALITDGVFNDFQGIIKLGQGATSFIGELSASSEAIALSSETPINVTFADVTFDPNLRVRESPKIIYEKYDFEVGNQNTEINFADLVIENALIIKTDPRPITKVIHNTQVVETVYDEWILFSYKNEVFFVKHGKETEGLIHFKPIVESEEKPQTEYTFDRFEKDHFGKVHIVVKNEDGSEMYVSRARLRTKADSE